jgi:hypothetical protein
MLAARPTLQNARIRGLSPGGLPAVTETNGVFLRGFVPPSRPVARELRAPSSGHAKPRLLAV